MSTYPNIPASPDSEIAEAMIALLAADPLVQKITGQPVGYEIEELIFRDAAFAAPHLAVLLDFIDERRAGSGRQAELEVGLQLALITHATGADTGGWWRSRYTNHIKSLVEVGAGQLRDPDGRLLTLALTRWQRLPPAQLRQQSYIVTPLRVVLETRIHQAQRIVT